MTRKCQALNPKLSWELFSVLQLAGHQNVFNETANSSCNELKPVNLIAFDYTPSKSSSCFFLPLIVVSELSASAASPPSCSFGCLGRGPDPAGQQCSLLSKRCEKPWLGIWPSFLLGLASEMRSCPWSPPELCYGEAVPKFTLSSLWLADLPSWIDLGSALLQGLEWQPQVLWPPLFTVLAPCFSFNLGTADLCPCQWVTASAVLVMLGPGSSSLAEQPDLAAKWHVGRKLPTRTN